MAEIRPLKAIHYAPDVLLNDVVAPPYDVIDEEQRAELVARSPHNVVEIDLPQGDEPYDHAAQTFEQWLDQGVLVRDDEPALWILTQEYTDPEGHQRIRSGFFAAVRVTDYGPGRIRPHERTHPGPKEDRLRLTRATQANLSPIFSLYSGTEAWAALEPHTREEPFGTTTDDDGTVNRLWRVADPDTIENADRDERPEQLYDEGNDRGAGITNRPLDEEKSSQASLPERGDDLLNRNAGRRYETPRQYEEKEETDPVMPAVDSTLKTKI